MRWFDAPDYWFARIALQRGLAAVYLVAFLVAARQFRALVGARGLSPIPAFTRRAPFRRTPSVFHLYYSDRFFAVLAWAGAALAAAVLAGLADVVPLWATFPLWAALWALYLSIVNVGQVWWGYGWETLLLEAGFLAIFLGNGHVAPAAPLVWLPRWLLFRVEFGAGLIKLRGDRCWRDLTCLRYHHETQPMPGPLSWYFHHLPDPLHRVEVAANHVAQLVVPFLLFAPQPVAGVAAAVIVVTQLWLVLSGNFSWLNWMTIVLGVSVLDGRVASGVFGLHGTPRYDPTPHWYQGVVLAVTALVVALSYRPARNLVSRRQVMNTSFDPLHLVNTYGAFGTITRQRHEIVIEGTLDADPGDGAEWREYEFKGKPGDPRRRPPQLAPYHLRLDWQLWFAALYPRFPEPWVSRLLAKLLVNDRDTVRLLRRDPFPDGPPAVLRARVYRYAYTTWRERRETGAWWRRTLVGEYLRPVSLAPPD
jgi:hypothetical protein